MGVKCGSEEEYQKAVSFYRDVLGMEPVRSWGEGTDAGIMLRCGASFCEICASGKALGETGALNHIALSVENVEDCVAAVTKAGYRILLEPVNVTIQAQKPYPVKVAFCVGPVGEEIEFFKEY